MKYVYTLFLAAMSSSRSDGVTQSVCPSLFFHLVFLEFVVHCFKKVSRVFQGSFKGVPRKFQGCFKEVSRVFQGSLKGVSGKFKGCFKHIKSLSKKVCFCCCCRRSFPSRRRACFLIISLSIFSGFAKIDIPFTFYRAPATLWEGRLCFY